MQPVEWCPPPSPSKRRLHSRPQCCNFSSPGSLHEDTHCGTRAESRYRCRGWSSPAPSVCSKELTPHATRPVLLTRKGKNGMNWVRTTNTSTVAGRKLPTWFQVQSERLTNLSYAPAKVTSESLNSDFVPCHEKSCSRSAVVLPHSVHIVRNFSYNST